MTLFHEIVSFHTLQTSLNKKYFSLVFVKSRLKGKIGFVSFGLEAPHTLKNFVHQRNHLDMHKSNVFTVLLYHTLAEILLDNDHFFRRVNHLLLIGIAYTAEKGLFHAHYAVVGNSVLVYFFFYSFQIDEFEFSVY